ncbi:DUF4145 domain-containing protein [Chryseobacterium cucumeris]|uniref:DUF4145 domain-containing protein n=1 Tax=Chryseobacterium cucumeris TaxID=1813611 RepID=UPI002454701C|nr:DUF4145 domain-containing protein [Chryseobacterium cucumeris]MDH5033979.1 DUF4145 domain-containing protein [Chryseobacterium cucumeris]
MKKELWKSKSFEQPNNYPCPKCFIGILIGKEISKLMTEDGKYNEQVGYPYGLDNIFSGILHCNNHLCNHIVSVNGLLITDISTGYQKPDGEYIETFLKIYHPKFFFPNLRMFPLTNEIPENIRQLIDQSFSLYFLDNNSCANKIRITIEYILDDLRAPIKRKTKKGKIELIPNLHQRIQHFSKKKPKICRLLLALKIIGNEGSHTIDTTTDDVLTGFEILELLVEMIYIKNSKRIEAIVNQIITK